MPFGNRLREARLAKGMTQEELASAVHVTKGAIGNYESEISSPKESILISLMKVLDVDANFLFQDLVNFHADIPLSSEEKKLVYSFRSAAPAIQAAVRKLLDLPDTMGKNTEQSAM